jgi:hypothetical protein
LPWIKSNLRPYQIRKANLFERKQELIVKEMFPKKTGYYNNVFLTKDDYELRITRQRKNTVIMIGSIIFGGVFLFLAGILIVFFWVFN